MKHIQAIPQRILTRLLVKPSDVQPRFDGFEVIGTFNPAAINIDDEVALLIRVVERPLERRDGFLALPAWDFENQRIAIDWQKDSSIEVIDQRIVRLRSNGHLRLTFISWLLVAFSRDGLAVDRYGKTAFAPSTRNETFGVEDPRLAKFGDRYYFTYVAVSRYGIATALASTADFQSFERHGILFSPENKDVILFPEQIDGHFWALHRPNPNAYFSQPEIWLARSPDLIHWGDHERLLGREAAWATMKVGGGTPPIRTARGWLSLYHGHIRPSPEEQQVGQIGEYAAATLLQDLGDPRKIIGLSAGPIMRAEVDFERRGYLPNIVFPTAMLQHEGSVDVYYGAADTATGVCRFNLDDLLLTVS